MSESAAGPLEPASPAAKELAAAYGEQMGAGSWELDVASGKEDLLPASETPAAEAPPPLLQILEALLFVGGAPLTAERATAAIRGLSHSQFTQAIDELNRSYRLQGRPYTIQTLEHGYALTLRPRFKPLVERLYGQAREARLSSPAIDVLSLVAYRQPVTKQEVDGIRGFESGALLRQLVRRGLITIVRRGEATNRQVAYGTTARFLELFKVRGLDDLPQTQDLQKL
jgi:segregation and condensation protein B